MPDPLADDLSGFAELAARAPALSPAGLARKHAMREQLVRRVVRRRHTRAALRAAVVLAFGAAALWFARPGSAPTPATPTMVHADFARVQPATLAHVERVRDDPALLTRWAVPPVPTAITRIDDAELLALLDTTNYSAGFVRAGARILLAGEPEE